MAAVSLRELLEAGAHFGHKRAVSHPSASRFVYTVKEGILVINVEKTVEYLEQALKFLKGVREKGGTILFVGTKPQAKEAVKATAQALGMPYVVRRWLGGTLTNFATVKKSLFQLEQLEKKINDPAFGELHKRERSHLAERKTKLTEVFEGILNLTKLPEALFVVDARYESIAIAEASRLGIPVVALMDTNADPDLVDYVIPANDESKRAIELILTVVREELSQVKVGMTDKETPPKAEGEEREKSRQRPGSARRAGGKGKRRVPSQIKK